MFVGATLFFTNFNDQVYATCLEISSESPNHVRFVPSYNVASSQATGIVIKLDRDDEIETNLNLLKSVSFDMDLADETDIENKLIKLQAHASFISCLDVSDNNLDNSALEWFSPFIELRKLNLANNRFDHNGLKTIGLLPRITSLSLYHTKVTATGIRKLENLKELTTLNASCTLIGVSGIKAIKETFPHLISLEVRGCGLDDQSLEYILAMSSLKEIDISSNRSLSSTAVQEFSKKALEKGFVVVTS